MSISTLSWPILGILTVASGTAMASGSQQPSSPHQEAASVSLDGSSEIYCDATPSSFGTPARIGRLGTVRLREKTFGLRVTGLPPVTGSFGMYTCGTVRTNVPFGNGYLCISPFSPGNFRMAVQPLEASGTCDRMLVQYPLDFSRCTPGSTWNFQFWYRDPAAGGSNFNLSDALSVQFAP